MATGNNIWSCSLSYWLHLLFHSCNCYWARITFKLLFWDADYLCYSIPIDIIEKGLHLILYSETLITLDPVFWYADYIWSCILRCWLYLMLYSEMLITFDLVFWDTYYICYSCRYCWVGSYRTWWQMCTGVRCCL